MQIDHDQTQVLLGAIEHALKKESGRSASTIASKSRKVLEAVALHLYLEPQFEHEDIDNLFLSPATQEDSKGIADASPSVAAESRCSMGFIRDPG